MTEPELLFRFFLAHQLGRPLAEILQMTVDEFRGWQAYFESVGPKEINAK